MPGLFGEPGAGWGLLGPSRSAADGVLRAAFKRVERQLTDGARRAVSPLSHLLCNRVLPVLGKKREPV